jgi:ribA/ribD-fused uncharacterized protein
MPPRDLPPAAPADDASPILGFNPPHEFGSNFFPAPVFGFPTNEHAFVAAKSTNPVVREVVRCLATPGRAKRYGGKRAVVEAKPLILLAHERQEVVARAAAVELMARASNVSPEKVAELTATAAGLRTVAASGNAPRLIVRPAWETLRLAVMTTLCRAKFASHAACQAWLLNSGERPIVEVNSWRDTFWGQCDGVGENQLGRILMQVRGELRTQQRTPPMTSTPATRAPSVR